MRFFKKIIENEMTYKKCLKKANKLGLAITRPEWDGIHIEVDGEYIILCKNGEIVKNPKEIFDVKKKDWMIVEPTNRALEKIKRV